MSYGKTGGCRGMSVNHRAYVIPQLITAHVHFHFRGGPIAVVGFQNLALSVDFYQLFRGDEAFADAGGSADKIAVGKLYRNISIICRYPAELPHFMAYVANLFLNLHFSHKKHLFDFD